MRLESIPEIFTKKVTTGNRTKPRDIFHIAAAARWQLQPTILLRAHSRNRFPDQGAVGKAKSGFVARAIAQLMIMPDYEASAADSLDTALAVLDEVLSSPKKT